MSEAGAIAAAGAVGFGGGYLLGIDVNALIGAFAGAMFFVVQAKDLSVLTRIGYFLVSWIFGYYIAGELVGKQWVETSGLVAGIGALLCVYVGISLLEWVQGGKTPGWLRFVAGRFGGRDGRDGRNG